MVSNLLALILLKNLCPLVSLNHGKLGGKQMANAFAKRPRSKFEKHVPLMKANALYYHLGHYYLLVISPSSIPFNLNRILWRPVLCVADRVLTIKMITLTCCLSHSGSKPGRLLPANTPVRLSQRQQMLPVCDGGASEYSDLWLQLH